MKLYSGIRALCGLAAVALLVLAFGLRGEWQVLFALAAGAVLWLLAGRRLFQTASALLLVYIALAVVGIMQGASALMLSAGCVLALVAWDLSDPRPGTTQDMQRSGLQKPMQRRLLSLSAVGGISMLLAAIASLVHVHLAFGIIALTALVAMGCLLYALRRLRDPLDRA